jgi:hypothetical protein
LVQPLVQSLIVLLADVWFPANERLRATEIGSMALLAGIGLAFVLVPTIGAAALQSSLKIDAGLLGAVALLTFVAVPADPVTRTHAPAAGGVPSWSARTWTTLRRAPFPAILILIFLANGYFNAIETWMESILHRRGVRQPSTCSMSSNGGDCSKYRDRRSLNPASASMIVMRSAWETAKSAADLG